MLGGMDLRQYVCEEIYNCRKKCQAKGKKKNPEKAWA